MKARASLTRHLELKKTEKNLESSLTSIQARYEDMILAYDAAVASETKLKAENGTLIKLALQVEIILPY